MKERPILFSAPMVRAIIKGRKTQTRRVVKLNEAGRVAAAGKHWHIDDPNAVLACPYGVPGDRLRVKEAAWMWCERVPNGATKTGRPKWRYVPMREAPIHYAADHPKKPAVSVVSPDTGNEWGWRLKIGRFLPMWASRIDLELTGVRIEWLQGISEADAREEGISEYEADGVLHIAEAMDQTEARPYASAFRTLWESINGAGSWGANDLVWGLEFKLVLPLASRNYSLASRAAAPQPATCKQTLQVQPQANSTGGDL